MINSRPNASPLQNLKIYTIDATEHDQDLRRNTTYGGVVPALALTHPTDRGASVSPDDMRGSGEAIAPLPLQVRVASLSLLPLWGLFLLRWYLSPFLGFQYCRFNQKGYQVSRGSTLFVSPLLQGFIYVIGKRNVNAPAHCQCLHFVIAPNSTGLHFSGDCNYILVFLSYQLGLNLG